MSIVKERKQYYLQRREENEKGIVKGIPWGLVFPKLGSILPVIPPGYQMMITGGSGIGKTQTWIGLVLYAIYKIKKEHPEVKLKVKLIIALLEDTKEMFIDRLYSMLLFEKYKVVIDGFTLQSFTKNSLDSKYIPMLDEVEKDIEMLLSDCEIIDSVYNPTGIYKACRSISNKYGTHHFVDKEFVREDKSTYMEKVYSHYEQHDPELQFLLIVDNLNNLAQEAKDGRLMNQLETINMWSRNYCRLQIAKHWRFSILNLLQQTPTSEQQQFTYKGDTIIDKIKPSLDGLGNSKECQRD